MNNQEISQAILCGLNTLSDPEIRIPAKDVELLASFKGLLRGMLAGDIVLASPDRILPEGVELPKEEEGDKKPA